MYGIKHADYVPAPDPATGDYLVGVHYFPGWKPGMHRGFECIRDYPERTPLIGYYDESDPEVSDWEIKWALEHGINFFIYCWYRDLKNLGKKVTLNDLRLAHEIHEGLFNARYRDMMKFGIMWEAGNCAGCADRADLLENLMPFWIENYFSKPNYLKIENKPVLFVYDYFFRVMEALGGPEGNREAFAACSEMAKAHGFDGMVFQIEYRYDDEACFEKMRAAGYDQQFAYCWHTPQQFPTDEEAIKCQIDHMEARRKFDPNFFVTTASQAWDPHPWAKDDEARGKCTRWKLAPASFKRLLKEVKAIADSLPEGSMGRKMIMLDNWNEWSEGHYLSPHLSGGFQYLTAVRDVLTRCDNLPDYRLPDALGLGPYDKEWKRLLDMR